MNRFDSTFTNEKSTWLDRLGAFLEVLLLAGVFSSFLASLPLSLQGSGHETLLKDARVIAGFILLESGITLILLVVVLRIHRESFIDLGWRWHRWSSDVLLGLGLVPFLFLVNIMVAIGCKVLLPEYFADRNPLIEAIKSPRDLVLFIVSSLIAGGIKEELQRAFILNRFRDHLGGATLGLILWSIAFGAGHYLQGLQGALSAGLFGLLFGLLYLVRGSLVAPMVAHGVYDTVALLVYWFNRGTVR
jgi:membrane protease YdiL (CAAX protease family)